MKNKKLVIAVVAMTMCATSTLALAGCAHEHQYEWETTKEATCVEEGERLGTCPEDGETLTEAIPVNPDAHAYGEWQITAPTMAEAGKAYKYCKSNSEHTPIEVNLPALKDNMGEGKAYTVSSKIVSGEKGDTAVTTFTYTSEHGEISFTQNIDHDYSGALTLLKAPTYHEMGVAVKACVHNNSDDVLKIWIPKIGQETDAVETDVKTDPTETSCGTAHFTFTHTNGEKVEYDGELPAYVEAQDIFDYTADGALWQIVQYEDDYGEQKEKVEYKFKDKVGRVQGSVNVNMEGKKSTTEYMYEFGEGIDQYENKYTFTHLKDSSDPLEYYYYSTIPDGYSWGIGGISVDAKGVASKVQDVNGNYNDRINGCSIAMPDETFTSKDILSYGVDTLVYDLYSTVIDESNFHFVTGTYTKDGKLAYSFSFDRFYGHVAAGETANTYEVMDYLKHFVISLTLDAEGMVDWYGIHVDSYMYRYTGYGEEGQDYYAQALSMLNPIQGYEEGEYFANPAATPTAVYDYNFYITRNDAQGFEAPEDYIDWTDMEVKSFDIKYDVSRYGVLKTKDGTTGEEMFDEGGNLLSEYYDENGKEVINDGTLVYGFISVNGQSGVALEENAVMNILTENSVRFNISNVDPLKYSELATLSVYLVEDGVDNDVDFYPSYPCPVMFTKISNTRFTLRWKEYPGQYKVKVVYGTKEYVFDVNVKAVTPESISANVYTYGEAVEQDYDYENDKYVYNVVGTYNLSEKKNPAIYASQTLYFESFTPPTEDTSSATDNSCTVTCKLKGSESDPTAITATENVTVGSGWMAEEKLLYKLSGLSAGEYEITLTSTVVPELTYTFTVTVLADPGESEILSGSYGMEAVTFDGNKITINDSGNPVTYDYTYNAADKTFALSNKTGSNPKDFTVSITAGYAIQIEYTVDGTTYYELHVKDSDEMTPEKALRNTVWKADGVYFVFNADGKTGIATPDLENTTADGNTNVTFAFNIEQVGEGYSISFENKDGFTPYNPVGGWFDLFFGAVSGTLTFDGETITALSVDGNTATKQ